ncbi:uncharacterized protein LOC111406358 [Olea europaea var. sylvestris]|uniref:Uncharacterized protein n=2 Tax=Olea europaea subsp. europaea TaxID=158383 RepID=A0A8S0QEV0_OLEEU|nr:uncharacterized protein LOC111406358 [Olea europaea var. sylvestris]CAA2965300.1 Hypothetical predicted protein [Olea europaea subsp. europaea]
MESVPATLYNGIKGYWKRNGYERLNGTARRRRKIRVVKLTSADGTKQRRRFWRIKLKIKFSPKKLLRRLRDAYVNMMMKIANTPVIAGAGGFPGGGVSGFGRGPMKEYDERMITEIYKSVLKAQSQMVPRDATRIGSEIICQRHLAM